MDLTHIRTENGLPTLVTRQQAFGEINAAMTSPTGPENDTVAEMYGSGSTYAITYTDGRTVTIRPATPEEIEALSAKQTDEKPNLRTHTGTVHLAGRYSKRLRTRVPACCASESAVSRLHFLIPTGEAVTCQRC